MKELKLEIEELEERIAPSFAFFATDKDTEVPTGEQSTPADHGAAPVGKDFDQSFGPNSSEHPNKAAWIAHGTAPKAGFLPDGSSFPADPVGSSVLFNGRNL